MILVDEVVGDFRRLAEVEAPQFTFALVGPAGAVQFAYVAVLGHEEGWDVGWHDPEPAYDGHERLDCELLPQGYCYYGGSTLLAIRWLEYWSGHGRGLDLVWEMLYGEYMAHFHGVERTRPWDRFEDRA